MANKTIKIKLVRSAINRTQRQKDTVIALGLHKLNHVIEKEATPQILGMVAKVQHLVEVVE
jgi:large subunit ribosomal protein L30